MTTSTPAYPSLTFPVKAPGATVQLRFPFLDMLQWGETLSSTTFTSVAYSGVDANPNVMLISATLDTVKTTVLLQVSGGVAGVVYLITCKVVGSTGNTYQRAGLLAVVSEELV